MIPLLKIAQITIRELIYEKVFYLLLGMGLLSMCIGLLVGQLTYAEQSKIVLDLMIGAIQIAMTLFSIFMGISLLHSELKSGAIFMVLSKPIPRYSYLLGKYLGQITVQTFVIFVMWLITIMVCATYYRFSIVSLTQTLVMITLECWILTAITYFFAVNAGAITAAIGTVSLFCMGHLGSVVDSNISENASSSWLVVKWMVPNLEFFNIKHFASYGISISWSHMGWALTYATICLTFILIAAILSFNERDIAGT